MPAARVETLPLKNEADIVRARQTVRTWANEQGFSLVNQTKIVTAASEIARNTVTYGRGGTMQLEMVTGERERRGLRLVFEDHGPGIENIELALRDGYTTGGGLGLGLGGAKRLCNDFSIESSPGKGTRITLTKWS